MATEPKTLTEFNDYLTDFLYSVLPEGAVQTGTVELTGYKRQIYNTAFGAGTFTVGGEVLTSKESILFEYSPTSVMGLKVKGLDEASFKEIIKEIDLLETDVGFKAELKKLLEEHPDYAFAVHKAQNNIINIIINRRAKLKLSIIEQLEADLKQEEIDKGKPYLIFDPIPLPTQQMMYTSFLKKVKKFVYDIVDAKKRGTYKTVREFKDYIGKWTGSSFNIITWAGIFSGLRTQKDKIPVLLGPCPLKHVDYIEVARSGKILKFRATGSVFLAAQEGGADAIKIEGTLYKAEFVIMFLLWALFIYGQSKFKDMENLVNPSGIKNIFEIRKLNDLIMTDSKLEKPSYEYHQTFPFVNRHFIIPNCYIETISIEDKLPVKDLLKYSILLRTYEKPTEVSFMENEKGKRLYGISNKTKMSKICEYSLNAAWRIFNASGWLLDEQEWKIGSATEEGVLDTYYDVDLSSLATISYLNLMGIAT